MWLSPAGVQMALIWLSIVGPSLMLLEHINGPLVVDSPKSVLNLQNCAILEAFRTSRSTDSLKWSELTLLSHYLLFQICFLKWSFFEDFQKKWKVQKNVMITWHGLYLLSQRERGISINLPIGPYITYVISRGRIRLLLKRTFPTISNSYIGSSKRAGEERSEAQNQLNFCPFEMQCNALQCTGGAGAEGYYWQSKNCTGNRSKGEDTHLCWPQKDW